MALHALKRVAAFAVALALLVAGLVPAACSGTATPTAAPSGVVASDAGTAGAGSPSAGASLSGSGSASSTWVISTSRTSVPSPVTIG